MGEGPLLEEFVPREEIGQPLEFTNCSSSVSETHKNYFRGEDAASTRVSSSCSSASSSCSDQFVPNLIRDASLGSLGSAKRSKSSKSPRAKKQKKGSPLVMVEDGDLEMKIEEVEESEFIPEDEVPSGISRSASSKAVGKKLTRTKSTRSSKAEKVDETVAKQRRELLEKFTKDGFGKEDTMEVFS